MKQNNHIIGYHYYEISSKISSLYDLEDYLYDLKDLYCIDDETFSSIIVSVTEAVTNAIKHGNRNDPSKKVIIKFIAKSDKYVFQIIDEGDGFDYSNIQDPTDPQNIFLESGRGLYIIKNLADSVIFNDKGNQITLTFDIQNEPSAVR